MLPKAGKVLLPAAIAVTTGLLGLLQAVVGGANAAVQVIALVLAFLQTVAVIGAVLLEAGIVTAPTPRPAGAPGYGPPQGYGAYPQGHGQPGQGQAGYSQQGYGAGAASGGYGQQAPSGAQPSGYAQYAQPTQAPYGQHSYAPPSGYGQQPVQPSWAQPGSAQQASAQQASGPQGATPQPDVSQQPTSAWYTGGTTSIDADTPASPGTPVPPSSEPPAQFTPESTTRFAAADASETPAVGHPVQHAPGEAADHTDTAQTRYIQPGDRPQN